MLMNKCTGAWGLVLHPQVILSLKGWRKWPNRMSLWLKPQTEDWHKQPSWPAVSLAVPPSTQKLFHSQHHLSFGLITFLLCVASKMFTRLPLPLCRCNTISFEFSFLPVELPLNYPPALFSKTSRSFQGEMLAHLFSQHCLLGETLTFHFPGAAAHSFSLSEWFHPSAFQHHPDNALLSFWYFYNTPFLIKPTYVTHCI